MIHLFKKNPLFQILLMLIFMNSVSEEVGERKDICFHEPHLSQNAEFFDLPIYDEYDDYNDDYFQEQPEMSFQLESVPFQWSNKSPQLIYGSYNIEHKESCELAEGNSFSLCFSSIKLLKGNFEIINEAKEVALVLSHICLLEQTDNIVNQHKSFHVFHDPVASYMENFISSKLHLLNSCEFENGNDYDLVSQSIMSLLREGVPLHRFHKKIHPFYDIPLSKLYESEDADQGVNSWYVNHLE